MTPKNYLENVVLKTWDRKGTQEQCFYGFLEEFGEITGKLKKAHRDDVPEQEKQAGLKKELGDWGWYIIHLGFTTEGILQANASKLFDRMARGKMHGSGDER